MRETSKTPSRSGTLVVAIEHHFVEVDGRIYTSLAFGYDYWEEYLQVFDQIYVLGRVRRAKQVPSDHFVADGAGVHYLPVPDYLGPLQFFLRLPAIIKSAWEAACLDAAFLLRSGNICNVLWFCLLLRRKPYAREVQGILREAIVEFTRSTRPLVGRLFAEISEMLAKTQLRYAVTASYVSEHVRRIYPTSNPASEFVFSSVRVNDDLIRPPRTAAQFNDRSLRIVSIGRLEREKGHHLLVEAAQLLRQRKLDDWSLTIVGPGRELETLQLLVKSAGLERHVHMTGQVQYGPRLFAHLDNADLFVLPSLTEGMPRSLIEAMSRGLPAIATRVGGVPELLPESELLEPGSALAIADAIAERFGDTARLARESQRNHKLATEKFGLTNMRTRKHAFWRTIQQHQTLTKAA